MGGNRKQVFGRVVGVVLAMVVAAAMLMVGARPALGQACPAQNWAGSTPNVWVATVSDTVMLNNDTATNQPTIPVKLYDGTYSPWGYTQHPQAITQLNTNWSCPSGTPTISIAGAGRETVAFQIFITAPASSSLSDVSVDITSLTGAGTLTSDNTGTSNVTRYLEGYVPYSCTGATAIGCVQATGNIPDPLIPFYDPYDSGNPAVATPFNVQQGTTQGVWVDISIPANQAAGTYNGTVTVSGNGIGTETIPLQVTVWNGNLPAFDEGSVNSSYADMLKVWLPLYESSLDAGEGVSGTDVPLFQKYQVMAHNYDIDTQFDPIAPTINGAYPSTSPTSFTTDGTTSSIDWSAYDTLFGPSLTPGGLFADGTAMRVLDSPIANGGAGAWTYPHGYSWCMYNCGDAPLMPAGLVSLTQNYATQISQHFSANHTAHSWAIPDLLSYTFDENYNIHSYQLGDQPLVYQIISQVDQAINASNSSLSSTWAASTAPIRELMTDEPACMEDGDTPYYTASACADHLNLSYPGGAQATPGYTTSWVTAWSPNPGIYMTGQPGPGLSYGVDPTIIAGTGYQYTLDLTQGVPALSTAPAPIERWSYNNGGGGSGGVDRRATYWTAYKYGQDETIPSVGDPNPATPAPGGLWSWIGNFWGGYNGTANASSCNSLSPYTENGDDQGDSYFFPGNELGCYYTANPVGQAALTASPAVNTSCTSNDYSVCNGISGPVATRELEQWRRGYEDYEYLYLYGKQAGRAAAEAVVASVAAEGMADWEGYDWENIDGGWYEYGVTPVGTAYSGNCTWPNPISSPIFGDLPNGLPNGPTGQGSSGEALNYDACEPLYSPDPAAYEGARLKLAQALGFASATTPSVTGLSPSSGLNTGGTSVQISGTSFTGATAVDFGGAAASFTVNSATLITAISPAGNGTVTVQVFGPGGSSLPSSSDLYTYVSPVTVTGVSPSSGLAVGGTSVNISGTDFAAGAVVMFGTQAATNAVVNSSTSITATAPAGSGTVNVTVTTSQGTSSINSADLYTYEAPPTVSGVSPNSGPIAGGTSVNLSGTGFASGMTVDFGGNAATGVTVNSSTSATVVSPQGSSSSGGVVDVTVTTTAGTSVINGGDQYNYTSPVTITGVSPASGTPGGGTSVVITGTGFTGATAVKFGGNTASFTVNSATQITAVSPAGGGTVDITVTAGGYSNETTYADQYSYTSAVAGGSYAILPTTNVGSSSSTQNVSITLASATAISSITVPPTQNGAVEFTVGTVTGCSIGGTVNAANTVCTVPVTFKPQYPGVRTAALDVNNNGEVVGTAGLAGVGQGPQLAQSPGAITMAIGGGPSGITNVPQSVTTAALSVSNNGSALAMDGAGNLYIADDINCLAYKVNAITNQVVAIAGDYTFSGTAPGVTTTPEPALGSNTCPQGIAVDGAGNVYIVDAHYVDSNGYPNVVEEVSAATGQIFVMAGGGSASPSDTPQAATNVLLNGVNSLATDAAGNLYISDFFHNLVEQVTPAGQLAIFAGGGSTPVSTTPQAATSAALNGPTGMVMDDAGNFYISDQNISVIEKVNSSGQIVSVAGGGGNAPSTTPQAALSVALNNPAGLAVDGAGDLYIADFSNDEVERLNPVGQLAVVAGGGSTVPSITAQPATSAALGIPQGVEVDGAGNLYIADGQDIGGGDNMIEKVATTIAPLSFPFTNVGATSVAQPVNLTNIGNQALTLNSVSAATDFPLQTGGTCTVTATDSQTLAVGTTCGLMYAFQPTLGGVLNEAATLASNNLNASNATQPIPFTGTGVGGTNPQLTSINPPSGAAGDSVTVTGTNLSGATAMIFGSTPVTPSASTSTSVTAIAPPGSGMVSVTVTTANGTSNGESFTYTTRAAATPTFSPAAGTYPTAQTVTISDSTAGATIYYTTNGTTPTTSSAVYSGPISVSGSETVEAIATASGDTTSAVGSAAYTINGTAVAPTFSPAAGTYTSAQTVTISTTTTDATIYYTTNGSKPTTSSSVYSGPISISASETLKAIAVATGYKNSPVDSAKYTFKVGTPTFSPGSGKYSSAQTLTISDGTSGATIYYTTDGTTPTTSSTVYSSPITVSATETVKALAAETGYTTSAVQSATYTLKAATPTFSLAAGNYSSAQTVTISTTTPGATIHYTTNGSTPLASSTLYSGPITVSATETVKALAVESGYTNSAIGSAKYTLTVATPTFSPAAGAYTSAQTVTISTITPLATIYYTTNGKTPTTNSPVYFGPITVSSSETIQAMARTTGYTNSAVASATYTFTAAAPTFSLAAGDYSSAQTLAISTATPGATIHYTTDGTTPTASSTVYSSPIIVSGTETVQALAVESGFTNSAVTSATYVLIAATPTFSPGAENYRSIQTVTISDTTPGATIYYTTDGTTPTASSTVYSGPITVSVSETVKALAVEAGYTNSTVGSAAYTIRLSPDITTIAGVQGGTTNPTKGTVAHGNTIGSPYGVAVAPVINGAGGDVYFDNSNDYGVYVIYKGGAAAKAILAVDGISSPVVGDVYALSLGLDETGPYQPVGLFVDSYGNLLIADRGYARVYMLYAGTVTGQGTNPADALLTADPSAGVGPYYGLHAGYLYHVADGSSVVGSAPTTPTPKDVWVDSKENVFFTDAAGNGLVEVVYNTTGSSANTILTAEGYTSLKQGYTYIIAGGQSTTTYPYDNDGGSSVAYNGSTSTANTALRNPWGIYGDSAGDLIFADNSSNKIKKLSGTTAILSTIGGPAAGTATTVGHGGDGGLATSAQMNSPIGVILDASDNVYFADSGNSSVRMIGTNGNISTVAGTSGTSGTYTGEGGLAISAVMSTTYFLSMDGSGIIYIADNGNDLIHVF